MYQITYQSNVSIKSLKYFPDHEGFLIPQGNIYLNNKKVGSFISDSWGGETMFHFSNAEIRKEVEKQMESDLKKIGFRTPHSNNKMALLDVKEEYIYHIGKTDELVKCLKNCQKKTFSEINVERKKARTKEQIMALDRVEDRTKKLAFVVPVTYSEFNNKFSYTIELKGHVVSMYEIDNAHKLFNKETKLVYADSNGYLSTID